MWYRNPRGSQEFSQQSVKGATQIGSHCCSAIKKDYFFHSYIDHMVRLQKDVICHLWPLGPLLLTWFNFNPSMDK